MRLKIGARVRLYFAIVIAIVLALGAMGYATMSRMSREMKGSLGDAFQASVELSDLRLLAREARLVLAASAAAGTTSDLRGVDGLAARFQEKLQALAPRLPPSIRPEELSQLMAAAVSIGRQYAQANAGRNSPARRRRSNGTWRRRRGRSARGWRAASQARRRSCGGARSPSAGASPSASRWGCCSRSRCSAGWSRRWAR